ncbi:MAG: hypothetical protein ACOCP2_02935 [Halohasta sp.]
MDLLGDLVDPGLGGESLWIHRPGSRSRSWSGRQFCVDAWKAGNLLRHYGVHEGATVSIADGATAEEPIPSPQAVIGLFGAWVLGASVRLDPPPSPHGRAFLVPSTRVAQYDPGPETTTLGFDGPPEEPTVVHFEEQRWSENPVRFPAEIQSDAVALETDAESFSHEHLLETAREIVEEYDLQSADRVALAASLADPGAVVAGLIAPLLAGTAITLGGDADVTVADRDEESSAGDRQNKTVIRPAAARP